MSSSDNEDDEQAAEWFVYHEGMRHEEIPNGVTHVLVQEGTTYIADNAFNNFDDTNGKYDSLQHIKMAASVTHIEEEAFYGCSNLVQVEFPPESQLEVIGNDAFNYTGLEEITLPESLYRMDVACFYECESLTKIKVTGPEPGLEFLYSLCFANCTALTVVDFSSLTLLTEIPAETFDGCRALQSIALPPNLTRIGSLAFRRTALETITFPKTMTMIESAAFARCKQMTTIRLESILAVSERQIHESAFVDCDKLHEILLPQGDDDTAIMTRQQWPGLLPQLFWENGGLLGPRSSEAQQLSSIFLFLLPRMDKLVEE